MAETSHRRNELETYIYEMRNAIDGSLAEYITEAERNKFSAALNEQEGARLPLSSRDRCLTQKPGPADWLNGDGADAVKSDYVKRLADLKKVGGPVEKRKYEDTHRGQFISALKVWGGQEPCGAVRAG